MKRQRGVQLVCPQEGTSLFENLPPEILTLVISQFGPVCLWRFCACSSTARWFVLTHHDIFAAIHATFIATPSVTTVLRPEALWGYTDRITHRYTIKHHFATWYVLKYRAMMASRDFGSRSGVIAFNMIALSVHKAFYVATHQMIDRSLSLYDMREVDYGYQDRPNGPFDGEMCPLVFRLDRVYYGNSSMEKYLNVKNCCVLVDYDLLTGIVKNIEYIGTPSPERYTALQRASFAGGNIDDIRTVVVSYKIAVAINKGIPKEDIRREIEAVFVSETRTNHIESVVAPAIQKKLRQFYDRHINEVPVMEKCITSVSTGDSSL